MSAKRRHWMQVSVGTTKTEHLMINDPLILESGVSISPVTIAYETYGRLNQDKSNVILVCHALSGDAHAAGYHEGDTRPGWWEGIIGPGKSLDTERYFVICSNILGGCSGTTGPSSTNPLTGTKYGTSFPVITLGDIVKLQKILVEHFDIKQLLAVAGGSMGGMQVLQWAAAYPEMMKKAIVIATTARSTPQQIAFNEVGRHSIMIDPRWNKGEYLSCDTPERGLSLARMIGHITYLSDASMHSKFGRNLQKKERIGYDFSTDFQIESYLHHQGESFTRRFDANSYLYITKAIDYFDLSVNGSLTTGLSSVRSSFLVVSVTSDWLYPPYQSEEIVSALTANNVDVRYCEIQSNYGHDAFLLESGQVNYIVGQFLGQIQVRDVMKQGIPTIKESSSMNMAALMMIENGVNQLPVIGEDGRLEGIVTSWDIAKAVANGYQNLDEIISRSVFTAAPDELITEVAKLMEENTISALPVVDERKQVIGIVSSDAISTLVGRCTGTNLPLLNRHSK